MKKVAWFSGGVSSFVSIYLTPDIDEIYYIHIDDQHPDTLRFINDCEKHLPVPVQILQSRYKSVENVIRQFRYINGPAGARCSGVLKRRVRKEWEHEHQDEDITYIWGFDYNEKQRAERLVESDTDHRHEFPLIEKKLLKADVHGILNQLGIKRPAMYDLGYSNNNCIGCVKGGMGYWNKIRVDFPEVFDRMAKLEREIGASCLKDKDGKVYLDELDPERGRMEKEIMPECGIMCQLNLD